LGLAVGASPASLAAAHAVAAGGTAIASAARTGVYIACSRNTTQQLLIAESALLVASQLAASWLTQPGYHHQCLRVIYQHCPPPIATPGLSQVTHIFRHLFPAQRVFRRAASQKLYSTYAQQTSTSALFDWSLGNSQHAHVAVQVAVVTRLVIQLGNDILLADRARVAEVAQPRLVHIPPGFAPGEQPQNHSVTRTQVLPLLHVTPDQARSKHSLPALPQPGKPLNGVVLLPPHCARSGTMMRTAAGGSSGLCSGSDRLALKSPEAEAMAHVTRMRCTVCDQSRQSVRKCTVQRRT
jgi:hypothetical protein